MLAATDLSAQKNSVKEYLHQVQQGLESVQDPETLKRVLSLVMQAASSLKSVSNSDDVLPFTVKERFSPAQKNEKQLQFKKTCGKAGRKKKSKKIRYMYILQKFLFKTQLPQTLF